MSSCTVPHAPLPPAPPLEGGCLKPWPVPANQASVHSASLSGKASIRDLCRIHCKVCCRFVCHGRTSLGFASGGGAVANDEERSQKALCSNSLQQGMTERGSLTGVPLLAHVNIFVLHSKGVRQGVIDNLCGAGFRISTSGNQEAVCGAVSACATQPCLGIVRVQLAVALCAACGFRDGSMLHNAGCATPSCAPGRFPCAASWLSICRLTGVQYANEEYSGVVESREP